MPTESVQAEYDCVLHLRAQVMAVAVPAVDRRSTQEQNRKWQRQQLAQRAATDGFVQNENERTLGMIL